MIKRIFGRGSFAAISSLCVKGSGSISKRNALDTFWENEIFIVSANLYAVFSIFFEIADQNKRFAIAVFHFFCVFVFRQEKKGQILLFDVVQECCGPFQYSESSLLRAVY